MNRIYLLRFSGGAGGDFLSTFISRDSNFYSLEVQNIGNNTWHLPSEPLITDFGIDIKNKMVDISDELRIKIDKRFSEKNLILRTHDHEGLMNVNLPRMTVVRLVSNTRNAIFFYGLLWLKRFVNISHDLETFNRNKIITSSEYAKLKFEKVNQNGYYRAFEEFSLRNKTEPTIDVIRNFFPKYLVGALSNQENVINDQHHRLDVGKFYNNIAEEAPKWEAVFGMNGRLDQNQISEYHRTNLELFRQIGNKQYTEYNSVDEFLNDLHNYVSKKCPDAFP